MINASHDVYDAHHQKDFSSHAQLYALHETLDVQHGAHLLEAHGPQVALSMH